MKTSLTLLLILLFSGCADNLPSDPGPGSNTGVVGEIFFNQWISRDSHEVRAVKPDGTGMRTVFPNATMCDIRGGRVSWDRDQLIVSAIDGSSAVEIPGAGGWPVLSPDAGMVAFVASESSGKSNLVICSSNGANLRTIMADVDHETIAGWSPDGKRIAIHRGDEALCLVDVATTAVTVLDTMAFGYGDNSAHIDWTKDGQRLAYIGRRAPGSFTFDIFTIRIDGSERTQVTNDEGEEFSPHWTPDGNSIIFAHQTGGAGYHLSRIGRDGSGLTDLTARFSNSAADLFPRLSADGTKLVYTAFNGDWDSSPGTLYLLDLATGGALKLADSAMFGYWENGSY